MSKHSVVCYFSVDIETSAGKPVDKEVSMISLGACVIGQPEATFYVEMKPTGSIWSSEAEKIHNLSLPHLTKYGLDPDIAMLAFCEWVRRQSRSAFSVFCATPVSFDWTYVDWYLTRFNLPNPFTGGQIDGRQLYRTIKGIPAYEDVPRDKIWKEFSTELPHTHNALDDALEQEEVFRKMLIFSHRM